MNRSLLLARGATKLAGSTVATLLVWALAPLLIGWTPVVITSGSMTPRIRPGDIVVTAPLEDAQLAVGEVITFRQPGTDQRVTHRIDTVNDDATVDTKGDANQHPDPDPVPRDRIEGRARILVPYAGLAATSPTARLLAIGLTVLAVTRRLRRRTGPSADTPAQVPAAPAVTTARGGSLMTARAGYGAPTAHAQPCALRLFTAGVGERISRRRRRQAGAASIALVAAAITVPATAVATFTGSAAQAGTFTADRVAAPLGLAADVACVDATAQVTLTWTAPDRTVDSQTLSRGPQDAPATPTATVGASATTYVDTAVPAGDVHYAIHATRGPWRSESTAALVTVPPC